MKLSTFNAVCDLISKTRLRAASARILVAIHEKPDIMLSSLASMLNVSTAAITGQMDRLTNFGFVTRSHDLNDRRKIVSVLTEVGQEFVQTILRAEEPK